jgi:uncharacterized protein (DUF2141 family)
MGSNFRLLSLATLIALGGAGAAVSANAADLSFEVTGQQLAGGKLRAALFADSASFLGTPLKVAEVAASDAAMVVFRDLPAGSYAVTVYQDNNGNSKLDRGLFNIPTEPYGFSRDARGDGGPPKFRDAQVELREPSAKFTVKLR